MAKSDETLDLGAVADDDGFAQPDADAPVTTEVPVPEGAPAEEAPAEELPPVKVQVAPDFEYEGDLYISIAELPEDLADETDRYKLPTSGDVELPAEVAAAFAESPAVEVVE